MTKYPAAVGTKQAKSQGLWLWHSKDGGRLYETSDEGYYFCATDDAEGRDPYVGSGSNQVSTTWTGRSPRGG